MGDDIEKQHEDGVKTWKKPGDPCPDCGSTETQMRYPVILQKTRSDIHCGSCGKWLGAKG